MFNWGNMTRVFGLKPLGPAPADRTDDALRTRVDEPPVAATGSAPIAPVTFSFTRSAVHVPAVVLIPTPDPSEGTRSSARGETQPPQLQGVEQVVAEVGEQLGARPADRPGELC